MFDLAGKTVWVAGHRGMVGSAIVRRLASEDCRCSRPDGTGSTCAARPSRGFPAPVTARRHRPGGRQGRRHPRQRQLSGRFPLRQPDDRDQRHPRRPRKRRRQAAVSRVELHLSAARAAADREDALLTGPLEPTNEWYAIAKIAGIKLGQAYRRQHGRDFISAMPTNLYGPGDNFDLVIQPRPAGADPQGA